MTKTLVEQFLEDSDNMRVFQQERAIYRVTELIEAVMQEEGVSRAELARRLGKKKGWVTQLLDGEANKTLRTVADVLAVLGRELRTDAVPIQVHNRRRPAEPAKHDASASSGATRRMPVVPKSDGPKARTRGRQRTRKAS